MPCLPTVGTIKNEKKQLILSGELNIGEPCTPFNITKSIITSEGDVEFRDVHIHGRKIPLHDIRVALLKKHESYMRLSTDKQISSMSIEIILFMTTVNYRPPPQASLEELQNTFSQLQRTRTLAIWHDHSTILNTGYILFAVWVVFDSAVFYSHAELAETQTKVNIQSFVEEPTIYMIAPSTSSPADQLALVGDRIECLQELSKPVKASNGVEVRDCLRSFCGDKPAQQFERGTQIGGTYKCGGCGCKDSMMMDLAHTFHRSWRSLGEIQNLVLSGKFGNKPGCLKPLDNLKMADLRKELQARGVSTQGMLKPHLQTVLTNILQGVQRVPTLLTLCPIQTLCSLNLEVIDCEPLHDLKGHLHNLLPEIPHLLDFPLSQECQQLLETTLPKQKVSGAFLRVAAIKLLVKLQKNKSTSKLVVALLDTIVRVSELLYALDQKRTPKTVLQLYNISWYHHELCCKLLSKPKYQTHQHLFGIYLHDLVVHAPPIYQQVCLRSMNAESQERLFSQAKHIGLKATNRTPENVLPTVLVCMQARQKAGNCQESLQKQESMVSEATSKIEHYKGTLISDTFILERLPSWQAHMMRISGYLKQGEGVWWERVENGYLFRDSSDDCNFHSSGPHLNHFRTTSLPDIYAAMSRDWNVILKEKIELPSPKIRVYNENGDYKYSTESLGLPTSFGAHEIQCHTQTSSFSPSEIQCHTQTSSLSPSEMQRHTQTSSLSPSEIQCHTQTSSLSPSEMQCHTQTSSLSPSEIQCHTHTSSLSPSEMQCHTHTPSDVQHHTQMLSLTPCEIQCHTQTSSPFPSEHVSETTETFAASQYSLTSPKQQPTPISNGIPHHHSIQTTTPKHTCTMVPTTLFEKAADPPKGNFEQSQVLNEFVECTMDSVSVENENGDGLRTKASKLFLKIIGDSENSQSLTICALN